MLIINDGKKVENYWEITFEINYSYHIRCVIEIFYYLCNVLVAIIAKMLEIKYEC